MSKEKVLGIVRHVLTFASGLLVVKGYVDDQMAQELIGGLLGLIGTVWSVVSKKD